MLLIITRPGLAWPSLAPTLSSLTLSSPLLPSLPPTGMESRASHVLGELSTTEFHPGRFLTGSHTQVQNHFFLDFLCFDLVYKGNDVIMDRFIVSKEGKDSNLGRKPKLQNQENVAGWKFLGLDFPLIWRAIHSSLSS